MPVSGCLRNEVAGCGGLLMSGADSGQCGDRGLVDPLLHPASSPQFCPAQPLLQVACAATAACP